MVRTPDQEGRDDNFKSELITYLNNYFVSELSLAVSTELNHSIENKIRHLQTPDMTVVRSL
ncbi:MAG: hypothetical protein J07HQW2_03528 [Haloquadratum walsbyi J07HQW2]|uniref:Uncharacterized protein n=1 Tax=Haloquadratum walsbyi J07HQW2 TaxID=1238425 RepID=U1PTB7_9EURY|nr:MAG: hypothetical protein J07HQW2_03528 [Haloquadratum walsbyi J07HQW2]